MDIPFYSFDWNVAGCDVCDMSPSGPRFINGEVVSLTDSTATIEYVFNNVTDVISGGIVLCS